MIHCNWVEVLTMPEQVADYSSSFSALCISLDSGCVTNGTGIRLVLYSINPQSVINIDMTRWVCAYSQVCVWRKSGLISGHQLEIVIKQNNVLFLIKVC